MTGDEPTPKYDPYWAISNRGSRALFLPSFLSAIVLALVPALALAAYLLFFR